MPEEILETLQPIEPENLARGQSSSGRNWLKIILVAVFGFALLTTSAYSGYWYGNRETVDLTVGESEDKVTIQKRKEKECEERGGEMRIFGIALDPRCVVRTKDAGSDCLSSADCEGDCLAPEGSEVGEEVTGKCSEYDGTVGCYSYVHEGRATPMICSD